MDIKILVVEDEPKLRKIIKDFLTKENFNVLEASDGLEALDKFFLEKPNLIILDLMLPKLNGFEILKEIRNQNKNLPVIMLTARNSEEDILKGYELKINEYIVKPISMKVLVAKVKSFLRDDDTKVDFIKFGNLSLFINDRKLSIDGDNILLSQKETELLSFFIINNSQILTREQIITYLWGYDYEGDERSVDSIIKRIRKKLNGKYITTVRGLGYKIVEE